MGVPRPAAAAAVEDLDEGTLLDLGQPSRQAQLTERLVTGWSRP
ncbi:MAG: hypothetical protein U0797_13750 [Gemmataceae bacterium]